MKPMGRFYCGRVVNYHSQCIYIVESLSFSLFSLQYIVPNYFLPPADEFNERVLELIGEGENLYGEVAVGYLTEQVFKTLD